MKWIEALKVWNSAKGGAWCVPKKGTAEHAEVMKIVGAKKAVVPEAKKGGVIVKKLSAERRATLKKEIETFGKVKKASKEAKIKAFLKKAIAKRRAAKEPTTLAEAKAKALDMEERLGTGAGADFLEDWLKKHAKVKLSSKITPEFVKSVLQSIVSEIHKILDSDYSIRRDDDGGGRLMRAITYESKYGKESLFKSFTEWFLVNLCHTPYGSKGKEMDYTEAPEDFIRILKGILKAYKKPNTSIEVVKEDEILPGYSAQISYQELDNLMSEIPNMEVDEELKALEEEPEEYDEDFESAYSQTLSIKYVFEKKV